MAPPTSATAPLLRAAAVRNAVAQNARMAPRYSRQASGHGAAAAAGEVYPTEGFSGAFWRNSVIALALSFVAYRVSTVYTPAAQGADLTADHDPNAEPAEANDNNKPFLTRYIAHHMPREGLWKQRNDKHLELTVKAAEDQLLIQDAQRPTMRRLRYPGMFEQVSPHCAVLGAEEDLSDLKVIPEGRPRAAEDSE